MQDSFLKLVNTKWKFNLFLLSKLPAAYFSGVRVKQISAAQATVTVPYKWFSTNPFKSTYFACLAMAAEMSTGILALGNIWKKEPKISMLVVDIKGNFFKKATQVTTFICEDGLAITEAINKSIATRESVSIVMHSKGYNPANELVASFEITWSFKAKG
jgi:hypothetical protein